MLIRHRTPFDSLASLVRSGSLGVAQGDGAFGRHFNEKRALSRVRFGDSGRLNSCFDSVHHNPGDLFTVSLFRQFDLRCEGPFNHFMHFLGEMEFQVLRNIFRYLLKIVFVPFG